MCRAEPKTPSLFGANTSTARDLLMHRAAPGTITEQQRRRMMNMPALATKDRFISSALGNV